MSAGMVIALAAGNNGAGYSASGARGMVQYELGKVIGKGGS